MDVTTAATPQEARELRVRFEHWLRDTGVAVTVAEDLGLAVYEALANAAEHAYGPERPAPAMRLLARLDRDDVMIWVIDHGRWLPSGQPRYRGRGLALMRHLTTDVHIEPSAQGTTVHLRAHLSRTVGPTDGPTDERQGHRRATQPGGERVLHPATRSRGWSR